MPDPVPGLITEQDLLDAQEVTRVQNALRDQIQNMETPQQGACEALAALLPLTSSLPISGPLLRVLRATLIAALEELGVCK